MDYDDEIKNNIDCDSIWNTNMQKRHKGRLNITKCGWMKREKEYRSCIYKTLASTTWVGSAIGDMLVWRVLDDYVKEKLLFIELV